MTLLAPTLSDIKKALPEVKSTSKDRKCIICRGRANLCGKATCPLVSKGYAMIRHKKNYDSTEMAGSSPPGVFVGRNGYPKVYAGPMLPGISGDTSILDLPEQWLGKSIDTIIDYRYSLVRGKSLIDIKSAPDPPKSLLGMQEIALSTKPVDMEASFTKKPSGSLTFNADSQPYGPSAQLKSFAFEPTTTDQKIEKAYYDTDLKAAPAIMNLYKNGTEVSRITKSLTVGMFGIEKNRILVPTRWGITAVDSTISKNLIKEIKQYPVISEHRVYTFDNIDNRYVAILFPQKWRFEWMEAWFPKTTWNLRGTKPVLMADWEPYEGRTTYPDIGGCYFSTKLAVGEALARERRQAAALVMREIYPGYIVPVGVWNVRESIRALMQQPYTKHNSFTEAFGQAMSHFQISQEHWIIHSDILQRELFQKTLDIYMPQKTNLSSQIGPHTFSLEQLQLKQLNPVPRQQSTLFEFNRGEHCAQCTNETI